VNVNPPVHFQRLASQTKHFRHRLPQLPMAKLVVSMLHLLLANHTAYLELRVQQFQIGDDFIEYYGSAIPSSNDLRGLLNQTEAPERRGLQLWNGLRQGQRKAGTTDLMKLKRG